VFERFNEAARRVVHEAQLAAQGLGHNFLGTEHLLLGVLADPSNEASLLLAGVGVDRDRVRGAIAEVVGAGTGPGRPDQLLATLGVDLAEVRRRAEETFGSEAIRTAARRVGRRRRSRRRGPRQFVSCRSVLDGAPWLSFCPRAKHALELAARRADRSGELVTPTHLLVGMLEVPKAVAPRLLRHVGVDVDALVAAAEAALNRPAA
jgi:ATP-dependent Clp protease ATP-binding subunit ClpA